VPVPYRPLDRPILDSDSLKFLESMVEIPVESLSKFKHLKWLRCRSGEGLRKVTSGLPRKVIQEEG
jgi:hypothetical protein